MKELKKFQKDARHIKKRINLLSRAARKASAKYWFVDNEYILKSIVYSVSCLISVLFFFLNWHLAVVTICAVYLISVLYKPNILYGWNFQKVQKVKYFFPVSFFIIIILSILETGLLIGIFLFNSKAFAGFLWIVLMMAWFSLFDYTGKLNIYRLEKYIYHIVKGLNHEHEKTRVSAFITFVGGFSKYIEMFNYRLLLQFCRVFFVMTVVICNTLDLKSIFLYSYSEMFDKAVVISLAIDAIFKSECEKVQKRIDQLQDEMAPKMEPISNDEIDQIFKEEFD